MGWGWFDATQARSFGEGLAQLFIEKLPSSHGLSSKAFEAKARETLGKLSKQVQAFRQSNRLNFYQKAKLGNAFKWTLRDAGYDAKYADELTEWLMLQLQ
jgi:hypothetical protein